MYNRDDLDFHDARTQPSNFVAAALSGCNRTLSSQDHSRRGYNQTFSIGQYPQEIEYKHASALFQAYSAEARVGVSVNSIYRISHS